MSLYTVKHHPARKALGLLCATLALLLLVVCLPTQTLASVTQSDIDSLKDKQTQISDNKKNLEAKITTIQNDKSKAVERKSLLEQQIEAVRQDIEVTNNLIAQLDVKIQEETARLEEAQRKEAEYTVRFNERVRAMEERGNVSYWSVLFGSKSFSDLLDNMTAINEIMEYDNLVIDQLEAARIEVAEAKAALENDRADQQEAKAQMESAKAELQRQQKAVEALVKEIESKEADYRDQLHALEMNAASLSREIAAAERRYVEQLAAMQNSGVGNGSYVWPLTGYHRISSAYGWRNCPFHGREFHSGIDLPAPAGTPILAAQPGVVLISTYHGSYGNYVVIAHPSGGKTLYAHMKSRAVSVGSNVSGGQVIGYVGTTGSSTGNHLHFEVWTGKNSSSRVNPMSVY